MNRTHVWRGVRGGFWCGVLPFTVFAHLSMLLLLLLYGRFVWQLVLVLMLGIASRCIVSRADGCPMHFTGAFNGDGGWGGSLLN